MATKFIFITACCAISLMLTGCVKEIAVTGPAASKEALPAEKPTLPAKPLQPDARVQAALNLTEQGRLLIEKGQADNAIRVLEQAINLNPDNGENYYYISEAWLMKARFAEAGEFNRLAALHLKDNEGWMKKVAMQAERIAAHEK